jgi:FtsH-binding integral membrane protein
MSRPIPAYSASLDARMLFVRKTYIHLAGAIAFFVALSAVLYTAGVGQAITAMMGSSRFGWLLILGGFMVAGYVAQNLARSNRSLSIQYGGLALYAAAEALIFSPMIYIAAKFAPGVLPEATIITLAGFTGLTAYALFSKKDFSFMGPGLAIAGFVALGVIIVGVLFGLNLGVWFSAAMILFASGAVVYSTSNVLRVYGTDQYVAAALDLFAAVALLFWYVLRILLELQRR